MKRWIASCSLMAALAASGAMAGEPAGRYQMSPLESGSDRGMVMILDSVEGKVWVARHTANGVAIIYEGTLRDGKPGEVIATIPAPAGVPGAEAKPTASPAPAAAQPAPSPTPAAARAEDTERSLEKDKAILRKHGLIGVDR